MLSDEPLPKDKKPFTASHYLNGKLCTVCQTPLRGWQQKFCGNDCFVIDALGITREEYVRRDSLAFDFINEEVAQMHRSHAATEGMNLPGSDEAPRHPLFRPF
jgi:hypothetical protein